MNLIKFLHNENVQDIYFASGARNASLLKSFNDFKVHQGFDERSMAFQALGRSKASSKPVVICTTSGTAIIEVLPAIVEAYFSGVRIILIAADRPKSLDNSFAPQMIDQSRILPVYARTFFDGEDLNDEFLSSKLSYPLAINLRVDLEGDYSREISFAPRINLNQIQNDTLFILNDFPDFEHYKVLYNKLVESGHYIYQEIESPFYNQQSTNEILFDEQLQHLLANKKISNIVRVGRCPNSKAWRVIQKYNIDIIHVDPFHKPCQGYGEVLINTFPELNEIINYIKPGKRFVDDKIDQVRGVIQKYLYSEVNYYHVLLKGFEFDTIYCGNSMPVRYLKLFKPSQKIVANRGANGIDGLISSAIGYASATSEKVILVLGDLSTFYDLTAMVGEIPSNLKIVIFNNFGGQIFDMINLDHVKNEHKYFISEVMSGFSKKISVVLHPDDLIENDENEIYELVASNDDNRGFWHEYRQIFT